MKNMFFIAVCFGLGITIVACRKDNSAVTTAASANQKNIVNRHSTGRFVDSTDTAGGSLFISTTVANTMISSYLCSINASQNDTDVQSFSINADSLRAYLANSSITNVKLMFAHTMAYVNAGNGCKYAGFQSGALTIVIAAYDANDNYVYYGGSVLDHCLPCPYSCPSGNAGNNLLQ
jgi:hypothetical protein